MSSHPFTQWKLASVFIVLATLLLVLAAGSIECIAASPSAPAGDAAADLAPMTEDGQIPLLIAGTDTEALARIVQDLGGRVTSRFDNIDAVAATVPSETLPRLRAAAGVELAQRQRLIHRAVVPARLPEPVTGLHGPRIEGEIIPMSEIAGSAWTRTVPIPQTATAGKQTAAAGGVSQSPTSFLGYDHITGAAEVWEAAGYGEGIIVVVIDTGIYPSHPLYEGNVIGGFNLVPPEEEMAIDHDGDDVPDGVSFDWDAVENHYHGTFVSGLIAGHMDLVLPEDDPFVQSLAFHSPESVVFNEDGTAAIRLMGTAPGASLFAVKVFPYNGAGAPDARVVEAIDRLISMKRDGTLDTDVINMSLSGPVLNDGRYFLDRIVDVATDAGITVVSAASNAGPALTSVGTPGSAFTSLTAGGAIDPLHTRVAFERFFDVPPGTGNVIYPTDDVYVVDFSSRGLTADRRVKPDIIATGFLTFSSTLVDGSGDGLNDTPSFGLGSGTSFSTPTIAGAAALVTGFARNEAPSFARPPYVANALRRGATPIHDYDDVSQREQGRGFVNLPRAFEHVRNGDAQSPGPVIQAHHALRALSLASGRAEGETPPLDPGMSYNFLIDVPEGIANLDFDITDMALGKIRNPILGDRITVTAHSAKRGGSGDYVHYSSFGESFDYPFPEPGTMRLTVVASFTNYSPASVAFRVTATRVEIPVQYHFDGRLEQYHVADHVIDVPDGLEALGVRLSWKHDWTRFPSYDLDLFIDGPTREYFVGSLNSPELALIETPEAGNWTFYVVEFGTVERREPYELDIAFIPSAVHGRGGGAGRLAHGRPEIGLTTAPSGEGVTLTFNVSQPGPVELRLFDVAGRLVRTLGETATESGEHRIRWDGRGDTGRRLSSGIYFVRARTPSGEVARKVFLK